MANLKLILGATMPVVIQHGEYKLVLHAKLDAVHAKGENPYFQLREQEAELQLQLSALFEKMAPASDVRPFDGEDSYKFADYVKSVLEAIPTLKTNAQREAFVQEHAPFVKGQIERLLRTPEEIAAIEADHEKLLESIKSEVQAITDKIAFIHAQRICFLTQKAELVIGEGKDETREDIEDFNAESLVELASSDTLLEWLEAVEKKALARWQNRASITG